MSTPLIDQGIHTRNRAKSPYKHMYSKLENGLHPYDETALSWAHVIAKVVRKTCARE